MAPSETLRPGLELGGFVLGDKLAVGGMAEIWAAHRAAEGPAAKVALKVLLPHFSADPTFLAMFRDEVAIASRLRHQNIVSVFGAHEAEGFLFQSMERIDGCDLRRLLSHLSRTGQRLPTPLALFVAQQLARALDYAHQRRGDDGRALDIVHRDVSPHNVMLSQDGQVKLLDFGVARAAERTARTRTGVIKGKLAYMAPEQALAVGVTPQTDIFATGIVLWEMLAQERLFTAPSDAELVDAVVRAQVPPIQGRSEDVPAEVATLLGRMLQARALERPAGMGEVERGLTKALVVHYEERDASERVLAAWLGRYGPPARPPTAEAADEPPGDDDTAPTPAPLGDPTLTYATPPEVAADRTWTGPAPDAAPAPDATAAMALEDPTPVDDGGLGLEAPPAPPGAQVPDDVDVLRTLVDDAFTPRALLGSNPTPGRSGGSASAAEAKFRRPTAAEIHQAVDAQATVEVEADPELQQFAQHLQVSAVPAPDEDSGPFTAAPASASKRPEVPTMAGALVEPDTEPPDDDDPEEETAPPDAPPPRAGAGVPIRGTESSGEFELVGRRSDPANRSSPPRPLTPQPAPPPVASGSTWTWILPAVTLVLAGVVLVLIFLLIRGQ